MAALLCVVVEARSLVFKKARNLFYEPDVQYERLTPMMKAYLARVGEKLVNACGRSMAEEAKRANILAAMPRSAPGFDAIERDFEMERIAERKAIQKILNDRDLKIVKATRFSKHIPPPVDTEKWGDNEEWVNAVMDQAGQLGVDTKLESDYSLLSLAAESLEAPLPPGWEMKRGGHRRLAASSTASTTSATNMSTVEGGAPKIKSLTTYTHLPTGGLLYEHPLVGYFRSIVGSRKMAAELARQGKETYSCDEAEDAMRELMARELRGGDGRQGRTLHRASPDKRSAALPPAARGSGAVAHAGAEPRKGPFGYGDQPGCAVKALHDTMSYRELQRLGREKEAAEEAWRSSAAGGCGGVAGPRAATAGSGRLPRVAPHEVGVVFTGGGSSGGASPHGTVRSAKSGVSFGRYEWDEGHGPLSPAGQGGHGHPRHQGWTGRGSALAEARSERQRVARLTEPHTQKVSQAKIAPGLDPEVYRTARKVLPSRQGGRPASGTRAASRGGTRGEARRGEAVQHSEAGDGYGGDGDLEATQRQAAGTRSATRGASRGAATAAWEGTAGGEQAWPSASSPSHSATFANSRRRSQAVPALGTFMADF